MTYQRTIIVVMILILTTAMTGFVNTSERIKPNKSFDSFPLKINNWKGTKSELDQEVFNVLGVEDYILSNYVSTQKNLVNLYVGFYQSQKEGDLIHSPKNCMPGSGWNIKRSSVDEFLIDENGKTIKVARLLLVKGDEQQVVLYWFQSRGRIISSEYMQKIWLVIDSITRHRTDGSFVRLITRVHTDEDQAVNVLKNFARKIIPHLNEYIPS